MYQLDPRSLRHLRRAHIAGIGANVYFLGLTSMLTDISSEMVASILPLYFLFAMGATPLQFGFVDGVAQVAAGLAQLGSGFAADRWRRGRDVAALGYGMSAICKLLLLAAGSVLSLASVSIALDRVGKGIRTSPRDALISRSAAPERLGMAFGIHRALDTAGALLGPVAAFALLTVFAQAFDLVLVTSFFIAVAGLAALLCFVRDADARDPSRDAGPCASLAAVGALMRDTRLRRLTAVGFVLGAFTVSDAFVFLMLQRKLSTQPAWFPLFYSIMSLIYLALAVPAGSLGDRIGRGRMFLVGHLLLVIAGIDLLVSGASLVAATLALVLLGAYYACTDGVLMALASRFVPVELRASGLGIVATANGVGRLLAALLFGALWNWRSIEFAMGALTCGLACALALASVLFARTHSHR